MDKREQDKISKCQQQVNKSTTLKKITKTKNNNSFQRLQQINEY